MIVQGDCPAAAAAVVSGHRISTVVPGAVTGYNVVHELTNMDLVMKLHYLRTVYYFRQSEIIDGLTITTLKEPMFPWLHVYYPAAGRIRRTELGKPVIKCNDCGVRIVEAVCSASLDEWLATEGSQRWRQLVPEEMLGPELQFSPLVYLQFTKFKCGSLAIGYSWAHVLGDSASATNCINLWGQLLSTGGNPVQKSVQFISNSESRKHMMILSEAEGSEKPLSIKQIDELAGDHWVVPNDPKKFISYSIRISETKFKTCLHKEHLEVAPHFYTISAVIWQCLAKIRADKKEPKVVTICRHRPSDPTECSTGRLSNQLKISTVSVGSSPADLGVSELAMLIDKENVDESKLVEGLVDRDTGKPDFVLYGANLTFVDMEGVDLQGLELKGQKPIHVDYSIDGVSDEGAVLVFKSSDTKADHDECRTSIGRTVTLILPEDEIQQLKNMLIAEIGIV